MKSNTGALILVCLITTGIIVELHQEIEKISFPLYFYLFAYYLRAIFALICIFYGAVLIDGKIKKGFHYLLVGVMFSIFSIGPSITSLYMFNSIEFNLLPVDEQAPYIEYINYQKCFLAIICLLASILASILYLRKRKIS